MSEDYTWLAQQLTERLRFYRRLTSVGLRRSEPVAAATPAPGPEPSPPSGETLEQIRDDLGECTRCALHSGRTKLVFGEGNPNADLMFIGEGPGHEEDQQGLPFVGPAGQLLTKIIEAIDLKREDVYIANIVEVPSARQSRSGTRGSRDLPAISRPSDRHDPPEGDLCARSRLGAQPSRYDSGDYEDPRQAV